MATDKNVERERLQQHQFCKYQPPYSRNDAEEHDLHDCACTPPFAQAQCHCTGLSNRWTKESSDKRKRPPKQKSLIAYLRDNGTSPDIERQRTIIEDFCHDNEYHLKQTFIDRGKPAIGLQAALTAMEDSDGLIASDLNRFVEHPTDRLRDLRPFVHHFFCHPAKHLITVEEGVDTGSTIGQANAVTVMTQLKESF